MRRSEPADHYPRFREIDGTHPYKDGVPDGCIEYAARRRDDGEVAYFNFSLAREMGLISSGHPERLTAGLRRALLETFSIVIVNEYDLANDLVPEKARLPNTYMATRYLQLQHRDGHGLRSGDGRSIWNGCVTHGDTTWDLSSCGTGVTRLCPATSEEGRFLQTGNDEASYGCGTAALEEGIGAALMSEVFARNRIATERVLAVISLPSGLAINVRAARSLLRPSHFFVHLRQRNLTALRGAVDLYIERRVGNGDWSPRRSRSARYRNFAEETARTFGRMVAQFESEYVFCWLDWDGDNILADGSIIDYGSVRQFGLYHREYRFDDVDRWSTTLPEQRRKARHIVRKFDQIRDALVRGRVRPLARFRRSRVVGIFDREYRRFRKQLLLEKIGFDEAAVDALVRGHSAAFERFRRAHGFFERARAARGPVRVPDGLSWNAIYSTRDLLRELPLRWIESGGLLPAREVLDIGASSYASRRDRRLTAYRRHMCRELQRSMVDLIACAAARTERTAEDMLREVASRSRVINVAARITGNSVDHATEHLVLRRRQLSAEDTFRLVEDFAANQDRRTSLPNVAGECAAAKTRAPGTGRRDAPHVRKVLETMLRVVAENREGL